MERAEGVWICGKRKKGWIFIVQRLQPHMGFESNTSPIFLILIAGVCFQLRKGIDCISYLDTWMAHIVISHARLSLFFQFSSFIFYYV